MFKNILNLQNHSSLIYHYLRNVNRNTPVFPTKQATMSWCTRSEVRLLHLSLQQLSLRKQQKKTNKRQQRNCCPSLILQAAHTSWVCQGAPCWLSHPSGQLLFGMPLLIPPECQGQSCVGARCSWQDVTSNRRAPAPTAFPKHSRATAAPFSSTTQEKCFQSPPWDSDHSPAGMTAK